jgi:glycosyltransferase involved in cell wall biosynthesis
MKSFTAGSRPILMTADTVGGVWTYALELAGALADSEIHLATMGARLSTAQRAEVEKLPNVTVHESGFALEWMDEPWDDVRRCGDWLLDLEGRISPGVVHLNGFCFGALPWHAPAIVVGHSCVLSWWSAVKHEQAPGRWNRYREEVRCGLRRAAAVVAPSEAMLRSLAFYYGPFYREEVIPNGRDSARFASAIKEPVIFSAGRMWDEAKNVAALDAIAGTLSWPVFAAGDTTHPSGRVVVPRHLNVLGELSTGEIASWYARASVYALPARYEPFGLSALEAALSGCALVLGDIPSLREVWGDAALFVDPEDPATIKRAIQRLISDASYRFAMAARAGRRARCYTPQAMARSYQTLYESLTTVKWMTA